MTQCVLPSRPSDPGYIVCDFVEPSLLGGRYQPVLCMLTTKTKEFQHIEYMPVKSHQLVTLHFKIVNAAGTEVSYTQGQTYLLLHFNKNVVSD